MKSLGVFVSLLLLGLPVASRGGDGHDHGKGGHAPHGPAATEAGKVAQSPPGLLKAGDFRFHVEFHDDRLVVHVSRKDGSDVDTAGLAAEGTLTAKDGTSETLVLAPVAGKDGEAGSLEIKQDFKAVPDGSSMLRLAVKGLDAAKALVVSTVLKRTPAPHGPEGHDDHGSETHEDHEGHEADEGHRPHEGHDDHEEAAGHSGHDHE